MMRRERGKQQTNKPTNQNTKRKIAATINLSTIIKCCCREEKRREEKREMKKMKKIKKERKILTWVLSERMNAQMGFAKILHPDCSKFSKRNPFLSHGAAMSTNHHLISFFFTLLLWIALMGILLACVEMRMMMIMMLLCVCLLV